MLDHNNENSQRASSSREVTDPVTHLPITISDQTSFDVGPTSPSLSPDGRQKGRSEDSQMQSQIRHNSLEQKLKDEIRGWDTTGDLDSQFKVNSALAAGAGTAVGAVGSLIFLLVAGRTVMTVLCAFLNCILLSFGTTVGVLWFWDAHLKGYLRIAQHTDANQHLEWASNKSLPEREQRLADCNGDTTESTLWLNSLLGSIWPIVNPSLFTAVADALEDTLQGTLPKFIRGVRVADIGQGSEPVRVVGVRYLDPGNAGVDIGTLKAEQGDFVNMEVAIAYRATLDPTSALKDRSGNAHLLMQFWLSGGIVLPVWVELEGLCASTRMRIQLTPNPPFLSVMTLTLLGQPKVSLTCTPLAKNFLNVMDVPGLSEWLQTSIDDSLKPYVAPGSLTLDLKSIFLGRPKLDTDTIGVVLVTLKWVRCKGPESRGIAESSTEKIHDGYITVSWSKWGKPLWSTRVIEGCQDPVWEETAAFLVSPTEFNAQESLRIKLWDSDRLTADDHLGTVDLPLSQLTTSPETLNKISLREDRFTDGATGTLAASLTWRAGYYQKTTLRQHLSNNEEKVRSIERKVEEESEKKFKETEGDFHDELQQQKREDLIDKGNEIITGMRPSDEWLSGILAINIEQISGLKVENIRRTGVDDEAEDEESDDLPSAYCVILLNHQRVYKTRTKMKSNNPFFNASTERFIRDWRTTILIIAVRDCRLHENDPLLGVLLIPLPDLFRDCSQVTQTLPIVGGIGYGRVRLSVTFRSVQMKLPRSLLGWDVGTFELYSDIRIPMDLPADIASCRLVARTAYGRGKLKPCNDGYWRNRQGNQRPTHLAVNHRYRSNVIIEFRKRALGPDKVLAFCALWLKDIPDSERMVVSLPVWKNEDGALERAEKNADSNEERIQRGAAMISTIDAIVQFWPGMSGYHQQAAGSDPNMADVMEILDCVEETKGLSKSLLYGSEEESGADHSIFGRSSDSGSDDHEGHSMDAELEGEGSHQRAEMGGIKGWKQKQKGLNRKHRGLMQWRVARNLAWLGQGVEGRVGKLGGKVKGLVKHQEKSIGVDTEV